jgi:hypothetical protein
MPRFFAGNFYEFLAPTNGKRHIGNSGCGVVLRFRSATRQSIRKERYWLRNRELVHGAKMYVMPQLGVRISWRERCKPGLRHQSCFSWLSPLALFQKRKGKKESWYQYVFREIAAG